MPTREIRTLISMDGEKEFRQQLKEAGRELRVLGSELKAAEAEFQEAGQQQEFLKRKTAILSKELEQQEKIVKELENAMQVAAQKFGQGSKEADGYAIELNMARTKASKMRQELNRTEKELAEVGNEMDDATRDTKELANALRNDLEDGADEARSSLDELTEKLNELKNMEGLQLGIDIAGKAWDMLQSLMDFTNEQRTNVRENRLTDARAIAAGYDPEMMQSMIRNATAITGDIEGARSAYGMMMAIPGMSERWLQTWSDMLLGADLKIPELSFEGLAEGLQETLSNRVLAGPFLELLERSGYNEAQVDATNEQLKAARTLEEAMNVLMTPLSTANVVEGGGSYADFLRMFMVQNEDLIEAEQAQTELADAMTELAEQLIPVTTFLTGTLADFFEFLESSIEWIKGVFSPDTQEEEPWSDMRQGGTVDKSLTLGAALERIGDKIFRGGKTKEEKQREYLEAIGAYTPEPELTTYEAPVVGIQPVNIAEATNAFKTLRTELDTLKTDASTTGADVGANLSTGIDDSTASAVASAAALAAAVSAALGSIAVPNIGAMMQGAMAGGGMTAAAGKAVVVMNHRKVGQMLTPTISTNQARSVRG